MNVVVSCQFDNCCQFAVMVIVVGVVFEEKEREKVGRSLLRGVSCRPTNCCCSEDKPFVSRQKSLGKTRETLNNSVYITIEMILINKADRSISTTLIF